MVLYGAALGAMNLMFYLSLQTLPFGLAVAIEFAGPLAVAIWSSRRAVDFVWVALAIVGLALLLPLGLSGSTLRHHWACCIPWARPCSGRCTSSFGKRAGHLHAGQSVSLGLLVAALVVVPVGVAHAGAALLSPSVLLVGVAVAAISSALPISLEMMALKRLPKEAFGIMISMEPAVAALLALALLGEPADTVQWLATWLHRGRIHGQRRNGAQAACGTGATCLIGWLFATYFVASGACLSSASG